MKLWRIATETRSHAANDISGTGAALRPGRWNREGERVVYCAQSLALAVLETSAYVGAGGLPLNRFVVAIDVPDAAWKSRIQLQPADLEPAWDAIPAGLASIQAGSRWLVDARSALLLVPSVIVPEEFAVLINPAHPDAARIVATTTRGFDYHSVIRGESACCNASIRGCSDQLRTGVTDPSAPTKNPGDPVVRPDSGHRSGAAFGNPGGAGAVRRKNGVTRIRAWRDLGGGRGATPPPSLIRPRVASAL